MFLHHFIVHVLDNPRNQYVCNIIAQVIYQLLNSVLVSQSDYVSDMVYSIWLNLVTGGDGLLLNEHSTCRKLI